MTIRKTQAERQTIIYEILLSFANLEGANLESADVGTNFYCDVNLKGVRIHGAYCKYSKPLKL